jgi:hypothetical protein
MDLRGHISTIIYKELEGFHSIVTWHVDVTQGDMDPCSMHHVSPGFMLFVDPMCPLECDMCHPLMGPCVISALSHVLPLAHIHFTY